jgi:hypothetical protein
LETHGFILRISMATQTSYVALFARLAPTS